jgi:4-carboxymuconolactone decarboxylase
MDERERHAQGMRMRRSILGDAHVDRAIAATTPLTEEFQDLITRLAWGEIWSRPALEPLSRRLMTIVMLVALNREAELRMHLRAALEHGVPADLLKESLLHSAVYCGVPAANSAFALLNEIVGEAAP